jgi:serine/threonine-protein kinase
MAPEQILRRKSGKRTDVYSLGCTLFAMLAGKAPFASDSSKQMLRAHLHEEPPLLGDLVDVPPELEDLVDEMLEKDPKDRTPSIHAVIEQLDRIEALGQKPATLRNRRSVRGRRGRNRQSAAGSIILLLILIGVLAVGAMWLWREFNR